MVRVRDAGARPGPDRGCNVRTPPLEKTNLRGYLTLPRITNLYNIFKFVILGDVQSQYRLLLFLWRKYTNFLFLSHMYQLKNLEYHDFLNSKYNYILSLYLFSMYLLSMF